MNLTSLNSQISLFKFNGGFMRPLRIKFKKMKKIEKPKIAVLGLSLELYLSTNPADYVDKQESQLGKFISGLKGNVEILSHKVCYITEQIDKEILQAKNKDADALLVVPMCYTASLMSVPSLIETDIPIVIFNTQELYEINDDFSDDDLNWNHTIQGTQDVTNILIRGNKNFGMETGHFNDDRTIKNLTEWLDAARTAKFAKKIRVGTLGTPYQDMGDFGVDESSMKTKWGPHLIYLSFGRFIEIFKTINEDSMDDILKKDREFFEIDEKLSEETHRTSIKLELALRKVVEEKNLDAFTMNFGDISNDGRFPTIPFLGINKMMSEGLGYAGEGNYTIAALMSQMHQLCGGANFTETYTVDFKRNLILMDHMQECNPAFARKDRKIRLIHMDFWAKGIGPYAGMHFSLEPGPVTLVNITTKPDGVFYYVCYETEIFDMQPLKNFSKPNWFIKTGEDVGTFLTRYSMAGGHHHMVAVPGHCANKIRKLAVLQNFNCIIL